MNITMSDIINEDCELNYLNIGSYILNAVLAVATIYSEFAGLSKCKNNGIIDGTIKLIDKASSKNFDEDEDEDNNV